MFPKACVWFFLLLLLRATPAAATDNYSYRSDEYVIISGGRSPDGRWAIAAHGEGEDGYDNFHLYLTREPTHEKLGRLRTGDQLDTGPLSIIGIWSPDSHYIVVLYRTDRHVMDLRLFEVADGKVRSIDAPPTLLSTLSPHPFKSGAPYDLFSRYYRVAWQKPDRLALEEFVAFDSHKPILNAGLKSYVTLDRLGPERTFTYFSASAVCEFTEKGKARFSGMKPRREPSGTIMYSPHLLFDSERGLHDTETTMSSLETQKARQ